jgi:hypothetical protein
MIDWRQQARAIRVAQEKRLHRSGAVVLEEAPPSGSLQRQAAFAERVIHEVLGPVLTEFADIVADTSVTPVFHHYDDRTVGVTCDLDSLRFTSKLHFLPDSAVRLTVFPTPTQTEGHCRDFDLSAPNGELEQWFGNCLGKLYENR